MNTRWFYLAMILTSPYVLTACDGGDSTQLSVVQPDGAPGSSDHGDDHGSSDHDDDHGSSGPDGTNDKGCTGKTFANALNALKNRNASLASEKELIAFSLCQTQSVDKLKQDAFPIIYKGLGETFSFDPGQYSHLLTNIQPEKNFSLLNANSPTEAKAGEYSLAIAGEQEGQRYVAFSENPVYDSIASLDSWTQNVVTWLTAENNASRNSYTLANQGDNKLHIIISQMKSNASDGGYSKHYDTVKNWLEKTWPDAVTVNELDTCNYEKLAECLSSQPVDLLILGDKDAQNLGYEGIREGIEIARAKKIPLMSMASDYKSSALIKGIYAFEGISAVENYLTHYTAVDDQVSPVPPENDIVQMRALLTNLEKEYFDSSVLGQAGNDDCKGNMLTCNVEEFITAFRKPANIYRDALTMQDQTGTDVLSAPKRYPLLAAGVLLADKYRQQIDYPISAENEPGMFQKALFADWVVNYSRPDNASQPDLGEFVAQQQDVLKGALAKGMSASTVSDSKIVTIPTTKQWTTSGWYAPAGKPITISSSTNSASVEIQLGYIYDNVYITGSTHSLVAPQDVSMFGKSRLHLAPGKSITFSTPYGGPIYIKFVDPILTTASLSASGVAQHPAVMDFSDQTQTAIFDQKVASGEYPHIDIRTDGYELHMLTFRFNESLQSTDTPEIRTTLALLNALNDYYEWNYSLAGFEIQGKTLSESLPADVFSVCTNLFGEKECTDKNLHRREIIQHINYDQRTRCVGASACSGNPFDAGGPFGPYGWGESHELGHNLQMNQLNVQYVPDEQKELWTAYSSRAAENSNNIFPYHTRWMYSWRKPGNAPFILDHGDPLDVYSVAMSELRGLKDAENNPVIYDANCNTYEVTGVPLNRYTAAWQNNGYAVYNQFREAFYFQMLLQADKRVMRDGTTLENGFNIFTLLYQNARIYNHFAADESSWNANRDRLGFSEFPYSGETTYGGGNVKNIPGNDFMLVALSYITNADWREYFDMFGLHYTSLANKQVQKNGFSGKIEKVILTNKFKSQNMPNASLSADPDLVKVDLTDKDAVFPGANWSCPK